jgi:hypothetical protein
VKGDLGGPFSSVSRNFKFPTTREWFLENRLISTANIVESHTRGGMMIFDVNRSPIDIGKDFVDPRRLTLSISIPTESIQ